jgi:small subunit ribosomal protein S16
MLRIRLTRTGKIRQPSYRVVVADKRSKRDGRVVERIGYYNPRSEPLEFRIEEARALHWLSVGAQPSDAVRRLLVKQGTYERLERVQAGEPMEAVVAEYTGVPVAAVADEIDAKAVAQVAALAAASAEEASVDEEE